jgi:phosphatidate cytidylyltransferase
MEETNNTPQYPSMNFWQRLLFGGAFTALTVILILVSHLQMCGPLFVIGLITVECVALHEYFALCSKKGFFPAKTILVWFSAMYVALYYAAIQHPQLVHIPRLAVYFAALLIPLYLFNRVEGAIANLATTLFGFAYIIFPLSFIVDINFLVRLPDGIHTSFWLAWLLAVTKGADIFAYIGGKLIGRTPLSQSVSPKKTIEGAVIGIISAAAIGFLVPKLWPQDVPMALATEKWILMGAIFGLVGMMGDLTESLLKRDARVKDSNTIPGLGGVLDVIDSLVFSTPLLYVYLKVMGQLIEQ